MKQLNTQLLELITASVDKQLSHSEQSSIDSQIKESEVLSFYNKIEIATKKAVQSRPLLRHSTPQNIRQSIFLELDKIDLDNTNENTPIPVVRIKSFSFNPFSNPLRSVASFIFVLLIGIGVTKYLNTQDLISFQSDNNFCTQSLVNYSLLNSGSAAITFKTNSSEELKGYFTSKNVNFPVQLPLIDGEILGATVSEINSCMVVTVVYKTKDNKLIAMSEMKLDGEKSPLPINEGILTTVNQGGWYWEQLNNNTSFVVWKKNDVLCAVVSDLPVDKLAKLFSWEKV